MSVAKKRPSPVKSRLDLPSADLVVVKVGSSSITSVSGGIDSAAIQRLSDAVGRAVKNGTKVVLVSSGAISAGLAPLGFDHRPGDLATQQAAASVGQGLLMAHYTAAFSGHGLITSQVLLTAEDLIQRQQYANAFRALSKLLSLGVVPIVNENDTVATHEIRFGDNDRLAALVAHLVNADALVLLSDVDSLYDGPPSEGAQRIPHVRSPKDLTEVRIGSVGSAGVGTGGMVTKVQAATMASESGIPALITSTVNAGQALTGEDVGTWFDAYGKRRPLRHLWLAHLANTHGRLTLDAGAVRAIAKGKASLLAAGVKASEGAFDVGDPIELADAEGVVFARGFSSYASNDIPEMLGLTSGELREKFGTQFERPLVHVDDLVIMTNGVRKISARSAAV
ncbi:glutamate 5-kinase [Neomicrococcus aestuarii]|uniref:Glutamate 5-kinase n=1 Tax=Neomicrococcus aestuarii TaxID=556325 RepID=A0A7W8TSD6_9MICC|nr:glutamate 5-kinase [Neomicrococcus aestuarii]MBB5512057.1 glutamate 5-kinase [Neomicrococcus aestuarii]